MIKDKLKEILAFILCVAFILGVAYMTGLLNGFSVTDFERAYFEISNTISKQNKQSGLKNYSTKSKSLKVKSSSYNDYITKPIPQNVLKGAETSGTWTYIFKSNKKVIFYVYNSNDYFNQSIINFVNLNELGNFYSVEGYTTESFNNMRLGAVGPSKICSSLNECNSYREKAANYTQLTDFMKRCGTTICIFNPRIKQYAYLKQKDTNKAYDMIKSLKNW